MDGERRRGDGNGDGAPGGDCGHTKCLAIDVEVDKAWVGLGEEDEEADGEPDADDGPEDLGPELRLGSGAEQVARLEVPGHVDAIARGLTGDRAGEEVGRLRDFDVRALALRHAADDELRRLGDGADGVDIGRAGGLHADEREYEREDEREDADADVHVE